MRFLQGDPDLAADAADKSKRSKGATDAASVVENQASDGDGRMARVISPLGKLYTKASTVCACVSVRAHSRAQI